jgi:hypothetical protein
MAYILQGNSATFEVLKRNRPNCENVSFLTVVSVTTSTT